TMAGVSWASNETVASGSSELWLEADFQNSLLAVTYSVVFVLGLVGNTLALYLLSCRVRHMSHSYIYLINLALVDTLFVWALPFKIHYHLHGNSWTFGDAACRVTGTLFYLNISLSTALFTCICVDRYVAVLHPFAYIQIRASHCVLVATALWVVALGVTVPLVLGGPLHTGGVGNTTACFEDFPTSSWTQPAAPYSVLALGLGSVVPCSLMVLGWPLAAGRICRVKRSVSRREALSTIYIILAICALCFLPYHLTHLLHFLMRVQVIQDQSFSALICSVRRVTLALVSLSCCLTPLLYHYSSSSKHCHCNCRLLRFRSKKVFTICDQNFGEPSWDYKLQQTRGSKNPRDRVN
ncbi:LPAR6 protein, partial [Onychorhynchus coronatus]|nr:LPAR6 protein [Onychorhynchus coronatus]